MSVLWHLSLLPYFAEYNTDIRKCWGWKIVAVVVVVVISIFITLQSVALLWICWDLAGWMTVKVTVAKCELCCKLYIIRKLYAPPPPPQWGRQGHTTTMSSVGGNCFNEYLSPLPPVILSSYPSFIYFSQVIIEIKASHGVSGHIKDIWSKSQLSSGKKLLKRLNKKRLKLPAGTLIKPKHCVRIPLLQL